MKILHAVHHYHPHTGGCELVVKNISERLVERGHRVTVATSVDPHRDFTEYNGVAVRQFNLSGNLARYRGINGNKREYVDFVLESDYDLLLVYASQTWCGDLLFPYLREIGAVKIYVPVGYSNLYKRKYREYYKRLPDYLQQFDHLIYMSEISRDMEFGDRHGIKHYSVIPNAASEEEFDSPPIGFRGRYDVGEVFLLLMVANFDPVKRHQFVWEAFRCLGRDDCMLVMLGNHPAYRWPRHMDSYYLGIRARERVTPRMEILEGVPRPWVISALKEADVLLLGSEFEGGAPPLAVAEAMASGIPFVSTDCGGVGDYSRFGVIVKSPGEMAEAVNALLDDGPRRRAIGDAARSFWKQNLTWDIITNRYEELYTRLLAGD